MSSFTDLSKGSISWEIELTTRCNSRCVGCSRYSDYYYPNPHFNPRVDLDFSLFKKALASTSKVEFILFCGVYGDPFLHPQILEIMKYIRETYGDLKVSVHTNGAYGTKEFWQEMASYFKTPGSHVKFSIDGIGKSHEMFRRGTSWETVLKNATDFLEAGGNAIWKMIEFQHNKCEVGDAAELAKKLGFKKFEVRANNFPGLDEYILQEAEPNISSREATSETLESTELTKWNISQLNGKKFDTIQCRSLERKNLYLDAHGSVWPCCWLGGSPYRPEPFLRQWMQKNVVDKYETSFNSLKSRNLEQILDHEWLKKYLPESWQRTPQDPQNPIIATCAKTCGKCATL